MTAISVDNSAFSLARPAVPFPVFPGERQGVTIRFKPTTTVSRTGSGFSQAVPSASFAGTALDLGSVAQGQSRTDVLTLVNQGIADLTLTGLTSTNAAFSATPRPPFTVRAAERQDIFIAFRPTALGAQTGVIRVVSNDPARGSIDLAVKGAGIAAGPAPQITRDGVVKPASFTPRLARGGLATIFGTNLARSTARVAELPLPASLGGASVTVGGVPAGIVYASPTQINFQTPFAVPAGTAANVVVTSGGVSSTALSVSIADYAVGVFTYASTGTPLDAIAVHLDNTLVTPARPALPNETLIVYATGVGRLTDAPRSGAGAPTVPLAASVATPAITVGGSAVQVLFAGLTPGFVGLVQFNIRLPASMAQGNLPLVIALPGDTNPAVSLAVGR